MTKAGPADERVFVAIPFRVRTDMIDAAKDAITEFISEISANEPGTHSYQSFQDSQDPTRFVHYMCFENAAAERSHRETPHVGRFVDTLYPLCTEEPRPRRLALVDESRRD